uniref:Variant surface glycoprotein 1125.5049 n=1 Tax=Trypanosoma brucei TaxID=5691 RepID=A0A1J0RBP9_9TRYP|nr:variant surface glycoprotein 1125.5049 [Trypanosoma brucei]
MTDSASICRIAAFLVAITIASEPATEEGLHETGKEIKFVCDTRRQLAALRTNLHAAVSAAESELSTGRHLVTKLQLAAAMTTGNDSLKFTTIAAGAAENLNSAISQAEAAKTKVQAAAEAIGELIGATDAIADAGSLSIEGKAEAQTSVDGLPGGKFQIRYGSIEERRSRCETTPATEAADADEMHPQGKLRIKLAHLENRAKTSTDTDVAALCGKNSATISDCTSITANNLTYYMITTGSLLTEKITQYTRTADNSDDYKPSSPQPAGKIPSQAYAETRLNTVKSAELAFQQLTFKAEQLKGTAPLQTTAAKQVILCAINPTAKLSSLGEAEPKIQAVITQLYGADGTNIDKEVWKKIDAIHVEKSATLDDTATKIGTLNDLSKLARAISFCFNKKS